MELKPAIINAQGLEFSYPGEKKTVLKNLDLTVQTGSRFGLFGPNGAGKTTLMNCLSGLLGDYKGAVKLFDLDLGANEKEIKSQIGLVPQDFAFYQELSLLENLEFFAAMYGLDKTIAKQRTEELIELLHLGEFRNKQLAQLSGGYKRRVNLAIGVLHQPRLLFLDEPTVGVDVNTRRDIIAFLKNLNQNGSTIFYTSHQLSEAEELCEQVALISSGQIIAHGHLRELLIQSGQPDLESLFVAKTGNIMHA